MVAEKALFGEEHSSTRSSKSYLVQVLAYSNEHSQDCRNEVPTPRISAS
jgi:hypothetical protein